jgi:MerR family copper efflux transcriptional regulator
VKLAVSLVPRQFRQRKIKKAIDLVSIYNPYRLTMIMENRLTRGVLARQAKVHAETIRFYEQKGLLAPPTRSAANYREYSSEVVSRVRFIKRAQELGFTLAEISDLLALRAEPKGGNVRVKQLANEKLSIIKKKIRDLQSMKRTLAELAEACDGQGSVANCPIIAAMEGDL